VGDLSESRSPTEPPSVNTSETESPSAPTNSSQSTDGSLDRRSCLYHYTSAVGLESILRQRSLRATDTAFLNDWQEILYAAKPLIPRMGDLLQSVAQFDATHDPLQRARSMAVESALNAIKRFVHLDDDMPTPNPGQYVDGATYVACLSEDHDQLDQWRAYGQGGYAIGFRREALGQLPGSSEKSSTEKAAVIKYATRSSIISKPGHPAATQARMGILTR
jgi:hypothetical protein